MQKVPDIQASRSDLAIQIPSLWPDIYPHNGRGVENDNPERDYNPLGRLTPKIEPELHSFILSVI